ncbi:MAG TPA: TlpA family protein disulfide reductase [Actinobacteria bacterium]|nr:TlpA family protein disulfide reductase [Actinomycetota bacterium]
MRRHRTLIAAAAIALALAAYFSAGADRPIVGSPDPDARVATDFKVDLIDGGSFTLSAVLADRPVVINFWASWCPPCRQEMPDLEQVSRDVPGVRFIGIAIDDTESNAASYVRQIGVTYPIAVDANYAISDAYGINVLPQTWLVTRNGTIVRTIQGAVTRESLTAYIKQDLGVSAGN